MSDRVEVTGFQHREEHFGNVEASTHLGFVEGRGLMYVLCVSWPRWFGTAGPSYWQATQHFDHDPSEQEIRDVIEHVEARIEKRQSRAPVLGPNVNP